MSGNLVVILVVVLGLVVVAGTVVLVDVVVWLETETEQDETSSISCLVQGLKS